MPVAPRPSKKATKIAWLVLGRPQNAKKQQRIVKKKGSFSSH